MLTQHYPHSTLFDDEHNLSFEQADVVFFGVAFDKTLSYTKGARYGPQAVINASWQVELELPTTTTKITGITSIHNAGILEYTENDSTEHMITETEQLAQHCLKNNKKILAIGGEHSISNGIFNAIATMHKPTDVTILHVDAHLDMRDALANNKYSHGSIMRRCLDHGFHTIHIGIRDDISTEEHNYIHEKKLLTNIYFCTTEPQAYYKKPWPNTITNGTLKPAQIKKICTSINTRYIYVTLDIDGIDPKELPGTGTPVEGGLTLASLRNLLFHTFQHCKKHNITILGMDITEISPQFKQQPAGNYDVANVISPYTEFTIARLIKSTLGYVFNKT